MAQFSRPDNDDTIGSWTDEASGTTDIYTGIDEVTAEDTELVRSEDDPSSSAYIAGAGAVTDPESSSDHVVRYRYGKGESGGGQPATINITIELRQSTTVIASQTHNNVSTTIADGSFTLSGAQADAITDYSLLNFRMVADKSAGARTGWGVVTWIEFEVPAANIVMVADGGAYVIDDLVETTFNISMPADTDSYAIAGQDASFVRTVLAEVGVYAIAGFTATLIIILSALSGSYVIADPVETVFKRTINAESGSFAIAGQDAGLTQVLNAGVGSYSIVGTDVDFTINMPADGDSYIIVGQDATFTISVKMPADSGAYAIASPVEANLEYNRLFDSESGSFAIADPVEANLEYHRLFNLESGEFQIAETNIYISDFSAGEDGWSGWQGTPLGNQDGITDDFATTKNDCLKYTVNNVNQSHSVRIIGLGTNGKTYRQRGWVLVPSTNSHGDGFKAGNGVLADAPVDKTGVNGIWTFIDFISIMTDQRLQIWMFDGLASTFQDVAGDDVLYVQGVIVDEVAEVDFTITMPAESGSFAIAGTDANLEYHQLFSAESGAYTIVGTDADFTVTMPASVGAYILAGQDVTLTYTPIGGGDIPIDAESGSFAISGSAVNFTRTILALSGSFAIAGTDANLKYHILFPPALGTYNIAGQAVNLEYHRALDAGSGAFVITGVAAFLPWVDFEFDSYITQIFEVESEIIATASLEEDSYIYNKLTEAGPGQFDFYHLDLDGGAMVITGTDVGFTRTMNAESGAIVITGQDVTLEYHRILSVDGGVFTIVGQDVTLFKNVYTSDFSVDKDGWLSSQMTVDGNIDGIFDGSTSKDNCLRGTLTGGATGHSISKTTLTIGKTYRVRISIYLPASNVAWDSHTLPDGSLINPAPNVWTDYDLTYVATSPFLGIAARDGVSGIVDGDGDIVYIHSVITDEIPA